MTYDRSAPPTITSHKSPDSGSADELARRNGLRRRAGQLRRVPSKRILVDSIRYSGVIAIAALVLGFSLYLPGLFFREETLRSIISNQAITGFLALGALIPLAAGLIDLSFGAVAGLSLIVTVELSTHHGLSIWLIALIAVLCAAACGVVSGMLVAFLKLDSLIITLGMASVVLGIGELVTQSQTVYGTFPHQFVTLGQGSLGPLPYLALALGVLAVLVWVWLEHTPAGRYTLAVGSNPIAARLAGVSVVGTHFAALVASSVVAGLAGVLLAAQVGNGTTTVGPGYLLPAIAALFLGATQVRDRPNVAGTLIAILLLGTGIEGLQLAGAATWVTDAFNGAALILAVAAAAIRGRHAAVAAADTGAGRHAEHVDVTDA
jgi:ribose transport system permease protein